ncbi:MAG: ABC transporter permease, partial [Longimicrobiales bacterium]
MIVDLLQDMRYAVRSLARKPGFTAVALVILAVGIGGNTAIFSVVRSVVLRPLPFEEPDRLIQVRGRDLETGELGNLSPADFMDFEREASSVQRMGANGWIGPATIVGADGTAERIGEVQVTEGFFPTLGVSPALGRVFTPDDDLP